MNLNYGGSMGEELTWCGFCLPVLLKKYDPLRASIIPGLIWALWHLPVDLMSQIVPGLFAAIYRIVWTIPLTVIFTWFYFPTCPQLNLGMQNARMYLRMGTL